MRCPDCKAEIDDDAEICPMCGMFILDTEEEQTYAPNVFAAASVLLGVVSVGVWGAVAAEHAHGFIPLTLITPLIGYGLGRKGRFSRWKTAASLGVALNTLAIAIFLMYVVYRAGSGESPIWL